MKPNAIQITHDDGNLRVKSPYNPSFVKDARALGGRWNPSGGVWIFDSRTEDRVRELLKTTYGTDQAEYRSVTVRLDAGIWWKADAIGGSDNCYFGGRKILARPSRNTRVILGDGVILTDGAFPRSGGSNRYPSIDIEDGTFVEVYDVPADHPDLKSGSAAITIISEESAPEPTAELLLKSPSKDYGSTIPNEDLAQTLEIALALRPGRTALLAAPINIKLWDEETIVQESTEPGYINISTMGFQAPIVISVEQHQPPEWQTDYEAGEVDPADVPTLLLDQAEAKALLSKLV